MKEHIYRILNIKFSESSQVFDLLTVQFFIGLANAFINIIAFTLFIYHFPIDALPSVYLTVAISLLLVNYIYQQLEHNISPIRLLKFIIGFAAVLLMGLWAGMTYGNLNTFIFMLLVSSVLIYMVTSYAFWGLVSLLFNVRESRRVFSIVGAGDIPAKLLGYLAGPLLIPFIGMNNLIWLAVFALITGLFLFRHFTRKKNWDTIRQRSMAEVHHASTTVEKKDFVSFFFKHKLIFAISLLSVLSYNVFILIDYTFVSQVKSRFDKISDLAFYIAIFFALGRFIALAFKLIFTSRVIERLGIISCLFITPVALFTFCVVFLIYGDNPIYNIYIFGVMAMMTEVLRSTMQEPVFFILFQPLKEQLRLKGHMISKGYMYPPSLIVVGLSLLLLYNAGIQVTILLAIKVILVNLCIWAGIIFYIKRTYLKTVHDSIKKGMFSSDDIHIYDEETTELLLNKVLAGNKREVIYALNLLEKASWPSLPELLQNQLVNNSSVDVKKYVLDRMEQRNELQPSVLRSLLETETNSDLQQKIIGLLCLIDKDFLFNIGKNIPELDFATRKNVIIHLLNQREFNYLYKAGYELNNLLNSSDPEEKELAVEIVSEVKHVQFATALNQLIQDKDLSVKRSAVMAVCKLKMQELLPAILALLDTPSDKYMILKGLHMYGDQLFEDIRSLPKEHTMQHTADLVKIAGTIKGPCSTSFLIDMIHEGKEQKEKIIHALWAKEYEAATEEEVEMFSSLLNKYLKRGIGKIRDHHEIPVFKDRDIVKASMLNEVKGDLVIGLKICAILYKRKEINRILELMSIEKNEKFFNALEMLELVLPKKTALDLNQLFDFILDPLTKKVLYAEREIRLLFDKVIFVDAPSYNAWTRAVCVFYSWKQNEQELLHRLKSANNNNSDPYIIRETRDYVLSTSN